MHAGTLTRQATYNHLMRGGFRDVALNPLWFEWIVGVVVAEMKFRRDHYPFGENGLVRLADGVVQVAGLGEAALWTIFFDELEWREHDLVPDGQPPEQWLRPPLPPSPLVLVRLDYRESVGPRHLQYQYFLHVS